MNSIRSIAALVAVLAAGRAMAGDAGSAWDSIADQTTCEAMNPAYCSGRYGFVVRADGTFTVGPNAAGKVLTGKITPEELAGLRANADVVAARLASSPTAAVCAPDTVFAPGVSNTLDMTLAADKRVQSLAAGCTVTGFADKVTALTAAMQQLLAKYYPRPF